jgi:hypothetical protein
VIFTAFRRHGSPRAICTGMIGGAILAIVAGVAPLVAHHSFTAEFDSSKRVTLTGTVTRIEWMNPHAYIYIDVPEDGATANWAVEMGSPNGLTRLGWRRTMLQIGEQVTIEGSMARYKPHLANARSVTIVATGQKLGAASSENGR